MSVQNPRLMPVSLSCRMNVSQVRDNSRSGPLASYQFRAAELMGSTTVISRREIASARDTAFRLERELLDLRARLEQYVPALSRSADPNYLSLADRCRASSFPPTRMLVSLSGASGEVRSGPLAARLSGSRDDGGQLSGLFISASAEMKGLRRQGTVDPAPMQRKAPGRICRGQNWLRGPSTTRCTKWSKSSSGSV